MKVKLKRVLKLICYVLFLLIVLVIGLEVSYRFQWFDFYKAELTGLNDLAEIDNSENSILIMGDSFSATKDSYVGFLNKNDSTFTYINSSIPGTGIIQHNLILKSRIKKYNPSTIIYQIYPSNDLIDIEKRELPKQNEYQHISKQELVFELPDKYEIDYLPPNQKFDNELFGFDISYEIKNQKVHQHKEFYMNYLMLEKENFETWNEMIKKLSAAYQEVLILKKK